MEKLEKKIKITFFNKNKIKCPICEQEFLKEELLSGRGRLIAGKIDTELRQIYIPSKKYGKIIPLIYGILSCPRCLFSSFPEDFNLPIKNTLLKIKAHTKNRLALKTKLFGDNLLFHNVSKEIKHGILGYILATSVYSFYEKKYAPSMKKALCSLRVAWLYNDLIEELENKNNSHSNRLKMSYEVCQEIFYKKASDFYSLAIDYASNGQELFDTIKNYGPDMDNNFGYTGMLYISVYLKKKFLITQDIDQQVNTLVSSKKTLSKAFGIGKSSRAKPSVLLNLSQDLFKELSDKHKELEALL